MFVYLHCDSHQHAEQFLRETLCTESLTNFLNEHFVVWVGDVRHSEAHRLSTSLAAPAYPFLCVLAPQSGRNQVSVVLRHRCGL